MLVVAALALDASARPQVGLDRVHQRPRGATIERADVELIGAGVLPQGRQLFGRELIALVGDAHARDLAGPELAEDAVDRSELLLAVRRTFITPFDRSDVAGLGTALDDAIDQMQRCAKKMDLFDMRSFEPKMVEMGEVIVEAAELIGRMVAMLPDMRANNARISALNVQMAKLEEKADELHDQGVKALYLAHRTADPMAYVVGSEIYDHLEKVVDRLEDIANRVVDIVIEHM